MTEIYTIIKRDGRKEEVSFDKILKRIKYLAVDLTVDPILISKQTINTIIPNMRTTELDDIAAENSACHAWKHSDYAILAGRLAFSNLSKDAPKTFSQAMQEAEYTLDDKFLEYILENSEFLDSLCQKFSKYDLEISYLGITTLKKTYLLQNREQNKVIETPMYMLLRTAVALHYPNTEEIAKMFEALAARIYTHATPTLMNAGRKTQQLASCFLLPISEDSIAGIYKTLSECALISKLGGGIGIDFTTIRANGTPIQGTGGISNGITQVLKVYNESARYVDQGGGKRKGSWCIYLEIWHADLFSFLDMRLAQGADTARARDLFYALWVPDLFMERVEADEDWTLFCPSTVPHLHLTHGTKFNELYLKAEANGTPNSRRIKARILWDRIIRTQCETGMPFMLYKDNINSKSNQSNLGTIRCSNLCTEIMQYSSPEETAVCNLASLALPKFVLEGVDCKTLDQARERIDFDKLSDTVKIMVRALNNAIDRNKYPIESARVSNLKHRPIGIGVQGLADMFFKLHIPFNGEIAKQINKDIFEQIYFSALEESCNIAKRLGPYETFIGSPVYEGKFQMDHWSAVHRGRLDEKQEYWTSLREQVKYHGVRNSLLTAPMPTASTAQLLGNSEMTEPIASNIYLKKTLSGEFLECNKYLVERLLSLNLWDEDMRESLRLSQGSVQENDRIPEDVKSVYKTVWEIPQKDLIDMARDRAPYIDQSQSLNLHCVDDRKMTSMHFHIWKSGLKGSYYRRNKPATMPLSSRLGKEDTECLMCSA